MKYVILPILFLAVTSPAKADWLTPLIKIHCIPERALLHISTEPIFNIHKVDGKVLKKHDLFLPEKFDYTCKLPGHEYHIYGKLPPVQEKGECGGDPRIVLNLSKDGKPLLQNVHFSPSCFDSSIGGVYPSYVDTFTIDEQVSEDYFSANLKHIKSNENTERLEVVATLNTHQANGELINQPYIDCLTKNNFFAAKNAPALATCKKQVVKKNELKQER